MSGQLITVIAAPLLTRLYAPQEFGVLAVYAALLGIVSVIASAKYELAIPLPRRDNGAANVLAVALGTIILISGLTALCVWAVRDPILAWSKTPELGAYLWLVPVGVVLVGNYQAWNYWAIRQRAFRRIAQTKVYQGVASAGVQAGLGLVGAGPGGLILGQIAGQASGAVTLIRGALTASGRLTAAVSPRRMAWAAARFRRFALLSSGSAIVNAAGLRLPALLMAALHGPQVAGWFILAERVVGTPMRLVGSAVGQVYLGTAAELRRDGTSIYQLFQSLAWRLLVLGVVVVGMVAIGGPKLFELLLGGAWGSVGSYVRVLAVMFVAQFVVGPVSQTLAILERQGTKLWWEIVRLGLVCGAFALAWVRGLDPVNTLMAYASLSAFALLLLFVVSVSGIRHDQAGPMK